MVEPIFEYQFRLILIGDSTVGKSSLLKFFTDGKFAEVRMSNDFGHCTWTLGPLCDLREMQLMRSLHN